MTDEVWGCDGIGEGWRWVWTENDGEEVRGGGGGEDCSGWPWVALGQ